MQDTFSSWGDAFVASLRSVWESILTYVPVLIAALIVLILGWLIANALGKIVTRIVRFTRVNSVVHRLGGAEDLGRMGLPNDIALIVGWFVKAFFIIVTLLTVVNILKINELSNFLRQVLLYIPQVLVGITILAIGLVAGRALEVVVERAARTSPVTQPVARFLATVARYAVVIFALMAALVQMGIAETLIQILFAGLVIMLSLAGGLALGLGGRDKVKDWIEHGGPAHPVQG